MFQALYEYMLKVKFFKEIFDKHGKDKYKKSISNLGYQVLKPGEVLFSQGDKGDKFYVII